MNLIARLLREIFRPTKVAHAATAPGFAATPVTWAGLVPATADTSLTAPTNATNLGTASANGTKIEEIVCQGVATTVAGVVRIFLHDGSTYHLWDEFLVSVVTSGNTTVAFRLSKTYTNLILPNASWTLRATVSIAGLQSLVKVIAQGGSL